MSWLRSRLGYTRVPLKETDYKVSDYRADEAEIVVPWGAINLSIFLTLFGAASFVAAWLHITQVVLGKEQAEIGFTILGLMTFIPGVFHLRIAICTFQGIRGFSYDQIPQF